MPAEDHPGPPNWPGGFLHAMQLRFAVGSWTEPGPATAWARQRVPLVAGEEPTGLQRLMVLADCGNGISSALPIGEWMFINPDLTVHLSRYPVGRVALPRGRRRRADRHGFGVATSTLYDPTGGSGTARSRCSSSTALRTRS